MSYNQTKSKSRVADHGEVFTAPEQVNAMLDLVKEETIRPESKFLEPACGHGNFLEEILSRKLNHIKQEHGKKQDLYEMYAITAISSIYGIDILQDNVKESQDRMFRLFENQYKKLFKKKWRQACLDVVEKILQKNILWGDTLEMEHPETKAPIIFCDWKITENRKIFVSEYDMRAFINGEIQLGFLGIVKDRQTIEHEIESKYDSSPFIYNENQLSLF